MEELQRMQAIEKQAAEPVGCALHGDHAGEDDLLCTGGGCGAPETPVNKDETLRMNTTVLAWLGDAVYEIHIRKYVIDAGLVHADRLHNASVRFVRASAQAQVMKRILDGLPEEEQRLVKRARNHRPKTVPKNADPVEYRWATAFEALLGYYYLTEQTTRLENAIIIAINHAEGAL